MRLMKIGLFLLVMSILAACMPPRPESSVTGTLNPVTARTLQLVTRQTLYVPAYSEIFFGSSQRTIDLTVTLAIHNTDLEHNIIVQSVRYYSTDGELLEDFVQEPSEVAPLATIGFVIPELDDSGGWGANFIVEWGAETPVYEPIVEAVMVSAQGTQGISMISVGRILSQDLAESAEAE